MWRILFILSLLYLAYKYIRSIFFSTKSKHNKTYTPIPPHEQDMVQDPICKTYIIPDGKYTLVHKGIQYYFCSVQCQSEFLHQNKIKRK